MSSRGSLLLGEELLAETKRLIPVAWLGFLTTDHLPKIEKTGFAEIDRQEALANFERHEAFLTEITQGKLNYECARSKLIDPITRSKAKRLTVDIGELLDFSGNAPTIDLVVNAIMDQDPQLEFQLPPREVINPGTGDMVKVRGVSMNTTVELVWSVCWITNRWLNTANEEELESMVTGYIWG